MIAITSPRMTGVVMRMISVYSRINDNGQCEDKTYLFSLNLFFIRHGLQVFGIVLR